MSDETSRSSGINTRTRVALTLILALAWLVAIYALEGVDHTDLAIQQVVSGADQAAIQQGFLYDYGTYAVSMGIAVALISLWWSKAYDAVRSTFAE